MPTPSTGAISLRDIATIIYNNSIAQVSLNDSDTRSLLGVSSGQISMSSAYSKPTAGNTGTTYYTPGSYSWVVVPYQSLTATVAGGGGGGGGAGGGQVFFGCVNYCACGNGTAGANSSFNGVISYGGGLGVSQSGGTGAAGGNNQNSSKGGGGTAGAGGTTDGEVNCNQVNGSPGGAGGYAQKSWTKNVDGPAYGATINFSVGAGGVGGTGGCRDKAPYRGINGGSGYVYVAWS